MINLQTVKTMYNNIRPKYVRSNDLKADADADVKDDFLNNRSQSYDTL